MKRSLRRRSERRPLLARNGWEVDDLTGLHFGRLVVIEPLLDEEDRLVSWRCRCTCRNLVEVRPASKLTLGRKRSCGCLKVSVREERKVKLTINGATRTLAEWSKVSGVPIEVMKGRLRYGWEPREVVWTPVERKRRGWLLRYRGKALTVTEWSRLLGIPNQTIIARLQAGMSIERALSRADHRTRRHRLAAR